VGSFLLGSTVLASDGDDDAMSDEELPNEELDDNLSSLVDLVIGWLKKERETIKKEESYNDGGGFSDDIELSRGSIKTIVKHDDINLWDIGRMMLLLLAFILR
jgi:hypothetical protein